MKNSELTLSIIGLEYIKDAEGGFHAHPYWDEGDHGRLTIGYGHLIKPNDHFPAKGIDPAWGAQLLKTDLNSAVSAVNKKIRKYALKLSACQFDALVSWVFNSGADDSDLWTELGKVPPNYAAALMTLNEWIHAGKKGTPSWHALDGLRNRRFDETVFFLSDMPTGHIKEIMQEAGIRRLPKYPWTHVPIFLKQFEPEQQREIMLAAGINKPPAAYI